MPRVATPKRVRRSISEFLAGERLPDPDDPDAELTYDALLALRGWGSEDFARATPSFLSAVRWALYAEKATVMYRNAQENAALTMPSGISGEQQRKLITLRLDAAAFVKSFGPVLFPEDEQ